MNQHTAGSAELGHAVSPHSVLGAAGVGTDGGASGGWEEAGGSQKNTKNDKND